MPSAAKPGMWIKLSIQDRALLRRMVVAHGTRGTSTRLGVGVATLDKAVDGLELRHDVAARLREEIAIASKAGVL